MEKLYRVMSKLYTTWICAVLFVGMIGVLYSKVVTFHDSFVVMEALSKVKAKYPQLEINPYGNTRVEVIKLENYTLKYTDGTKVFYHELGERYNGNKYINMYTRDLEEAGFEVSVYADSRYISTNLLTWGGQEFSNFWRGIGISLCWIFGTVFMISLSAGIRRWLIWLSK